jgi:hypothetical protein
MEITVYDKAAWHIDADVPTAMVLKHFEFILKWANSHNLLSEEGKEVLEFGVDESVSLHSNMFTPRGNRFMEMNYDAFIGAMEEDTEHLNEALSKVS